MENKKNFTIGFLSGICMTLFLFIILGMGTNSKNNFAYIPVNEDGSINVKLSSSDIEEIKPPLRQEVDIRAIMGWNVATYEEYTLSGQKYNSIGVTVLD